MFGILSDRFSDLIDSIIHSVPITVIVALDLVLAKSIRFDAVFEVVGLLSGTRHVRPVELVAKLRKLVVVWMPL